MSSDASAYHWFLLVSNGNNTLTFASLFTASSSSALLFQVSIFRRESEFSLQVLFRVVQPFIPSSYLVWKLLKMNFDLCRWNLCFLFKLDGVIVEQLIKALSSKSSLRLSSVSALPKELFHSILLCKWYL